MSDGRPGVLLDTCAPNSLMKGSSMARPAMEAPLAARRARGIFVSPVSAWEIGLLARPGRRTTPGPGVLTAGGTADAP